MPTGREMLGASLATLQGIGKSLSKLEGKLPAEQMRSTAAHLQDLEKRTEVLSERVTMRAKGSDNLAYPVCEGAGRLNESFEALLTSQPGSNEDSLADFQTDVEALEREVAALEEVVRARTVVVT